MAKNIELTPIESLPGLLSRSKHAQSHWALLSPQQRSSLLLQVRETLINRVDELSQIIAEETGRESFTIMTTELLPAVTLLTFLCNRAPAILHSQRKKLHYLPYRVNITSWKPLGVIASIGSRDFPFFTGISDLIPALLAGNSLFYAPHPDRLTTGKQLFDIFDEAGLPQDLLIPVFGSPDLPAAISKLDINHLSWIGKTENHSASLAIVLADANLDLAASALAWHRSVLPKEGNDLIQQPKILVHESVAAEFSKLLNENQLLSFKSLNEAINITNSLSPLLTVSIMTRNFGLAEQLSKQLNAPNVVINETLLPAGQPDVPWLIGETGKTIPVHGEECILKFVARQNLNRPLSRVFTFKSPWWLPYTDFQRDTYRQVFDVFKRHWIDKLRAFPLFLIGLVQFLKRQK
jgi:acyl-CoA reductase-like NAD-dependent aldehyde dehydrogenase